MSRLDLPRYSWITLPRAGAKPFLIKNEFVPIGITPFVDHCFPFRSLSDFFGRPPSLPHSRMRFWNSFLPHFFWRTSALRLPSALAASFTSGLDFGRFTLNIINLTLGYVKRQLLSKLYR